MFVDNHVVANRQTLAAARPDLFGREKRIEDAVANLVRNSAPCVFNLDRCVGRCQLRAHFVVHLRDEYVDLHFTAGVDPQMPGAERIAHRGGQMLLRRYRGPSSRWQRPVLERRGSGEIGEDGAESGCGLTPKASRLGHEYDQARSRQGGLSYTGVRSSGHQQRL